MCAMEAHGRCLPKFALVTPTVYPAPRRTSTGFDYTRLNLLSAVLEKRLGLRLGTTDIYMNVVGGLRVDDPSADLPACMALISGCKDIPLNDKLVAMGEIGLPVNAAPLPESSIVYVNASVLALKRWLSRVGIMKNPKHSWIKSPERQPSCR